MFLFRKLSGRSGLSTTHQDDSNTSSRDEDDFSKQALDRASEYVSEGDYEEALWILERLGQLDPSVKGVSELAAVAEVCNAAIWRSCNCLSRENSRPDWYKILKVDEKSELSDIKKRYRHLALLLHPDKNKHVKAEAAFKLVSEAYACLSDKKKREIFNAKKSFEKCKQCSSRDCAASGSDRWSGYHVLSEKTSLRRPGSSPDLTQTDWILDQERLRTFRARARARIFGNLEKAWKDRCFTEFDRGNIVKDDFEKNFKDQIRMNAGQRHSKPRTRKTNHKKKETSTDCSSVVGDKDSQVEGNTMNESKQQKTSHQLYRPCKNLGFLIRDLQAELVSNTENRGSQNDEQENAVCQKPTPESSQRVDAIDSETHMQDDNWTMGMSGSHTQGGFVQQPSGTRRQVDPHNQEVTAEQETVCAMCNHSPLLSRHGHIYPDGFSHNGAHTLKDDETRPINIISKKISDKVCSHKEEREYVRGSEEKDYIRTATQHEDNGRTVLKKHNLCGQASKDDSLDLEEKILQTQREKSEQLLMTLQRLREETRTVAASLNHLCSGCSS